MKDRMLVYVSLALSVTSISYSTWLHHQGSEMLAMGALRQREAELVRHWKPKFDSLWEGMGVDPTVIPKDPTTLEDLFDPLVALMNRVGDASGGQTNKTIK